MNTNIIYLLLFFVSKQYVQGSLLDYVLSFGSQTENPKNVNINNGEIDQNIPYEVATIDEKFINEAAQLTGLALSELDSCQHRVVLKLQTECHNLNDEQVSKLAVMLLNCQSAIEGRPIYPCTEYMTLRECTSSMDPDIWNSYHIMTNRARAVCYSVRQSQFRGLTEMTVNKLMHSAHEQLKSMSYLADGQHKLHEATLNSIQAVSDGQEQLKRQQADLQQAQLMGQLSIEDNIQQLVKEKALIKAGHEQIAKMTTDVRLKLDEASTQIELQNEDQRHKHNQILRDLMAIQKKSEAIWQRIEESTTHMLEQSARAARQYEVTLSQLEQVNSTVHEVFNLVEQSRAAIDNKLTWLTDTLGGTGNTIDKLYTCLSHILFLIFSMILCSFLNVPKITRYVVVIIVPLNLILSLQKGIDNAFPLPGLSFVIVSVTIAHFVLFAILSFVSQNNLPHQALTWIKSSKKLFIKANNATLSNQNENDSRPNSTNEYLVNPNKFETRNVYNKDVSSTNMNYDPIITGEDDDIIPEFNRNYHEFASPTPPLSRSDIYLSRRSRSRSNTPILSPVSPNGSLRRNCSATTRVGTMCKNSSLPGRDYCYRHQNGDSIIG